MTHVLLMVPDLGLLGGFNEQLEFLKARGCTYAQGFLFSQPLPYGEFAVLAAGMLKDETIA